MLRSIRVYFAVYAFIVVSFVSGGCGGSDSPDSSGIVGSFLVGYAGGGEFGDQQGLVLASPAGAVSWVSGYYPVNNSIDYVDMKNGRIAMAVANPPAGSSCIAYMDLGDLANVRFVPVPPSDVADTYWEVPAMRPQVMADGRIIFKVVLQTSNPYDDAHWGQLAIYSPETERFVFSGDLSAFVGSQPEIGVDTELGSMGNGFALAPDDSFVCLDAYGYGTETGQYHVDASFIVKYTIASGTYSRVLAARNAISFISSGGDAVVADIDGKKYRIDVNTGAKAVLDDYTAFIAVGQYGTQTGVLLKEWRGSGISLFSTSSGFAHNVVLGENLPQPYRGLGTGCQLSEDESTVFFKATTDFYTNYKSEFGVFSTPLNLGAPDSNPTKLFVLPAVYDSDMLLLLHE